MAKSQVRTTENSLPASKTSMVCSCSGPLRQRLARHPLRMLLLAAWAFLLPLALLVACQATPAAEELRTEVALVRAHLAEGNGDTVFRIEVDLRDVQGHAVEGWEVQAEVFDANDQSIASVPCEPVPRQAGAYHSAAFAKPAAAPGPWRIQVSVGKGAAIAESWWTFRVNGAEATAGEAASPQDQAQQVASEQVQPAAINAQPASSTTAASAQWQAHRTNNAVLFGLLVALATLIAFVGIWRTVRPQDPLEARMQEYGIDGNSAFAEVARPATGLRSLSPLKRLANGLGMGPRLAEQLAQADVPLTASEFTLLTIAAALLGILIGMWRFGFLLGLILGAMLGYLPSLYLKTSLSRRRRLFTEQLPDVLMLLVGALRAGYGLTQGLQVLVEQLPNPASKEFARVVNSVSLGVSIQQALSDLSERVQTDDVGLIVTAINVQYEVGGNLAETLDTIGETIRDRIRIKGEINALTAEEQLTGYVLVALPAVLGVVLFTMSPEYMSGLFAPGLYRLLPVVAVMLQFLGYLVIRKIIDIEV